MPYVVSLVKQVPIADREQYVNDCCIGGDVVLGRLLPALRAWHGGELEAVQEDWGWFVWFRHAGIDLAIDAHTDDAERGEFRLHLTSRRPRFLLGGKVVDTPELEALKDLVVAELRAWPAESLELQRTDERYDPI